MQTSDAATTYGAGLVGDRRRGQPSGRTEIHVDGDGVLRSRPDPPPPSASSATPQRSRAACRENSTRLDILLDA